MDRVAPLGFLTSIASIAPMSQMSDYFNIFQPSFNGHGSKVLKSIPWLRDAESSELRRREKDPSCGSCDAFDHVPAPVGPGTSRAPIHRNS